MSLWALFCYYANYFWQVLWAPFSIALWQHIYTLPAVLILQEMADTYGLLCLGLLMLLGQILARNLMFSIFCSSVNALKNIGLQLSSLSKVLNISKRLSYPATVLRFLKLKLTNVAAKVYNFFKS